MGTVETAEVTVNVNNECINHGSPSSCRFCPIALAIQDILKDGYRPSVGLPSYGIIDIERREPIYCNVLPLEARDFIRNFDAPRLYRTEPQPFLFPITLPRKVVRQDVLERLDHEASDKV